jgi:hypothetical protein
MTVSAGFTILAINRVVTVFEGIYLHHRFQLQTLVSTVKPSEAYDTHMGCGVLGSRSLKA